MRRTALQMVLGGWLLLALLAGAAIGWAWARLGADLAPPGAQQLQIERSGLLKTRLQFQLPPEQTVYDLLQFLQRQGWRRVRSPAGEEGTLLFVRRTWSGRVRDVLLLTPDPRDRRRIEILFGRCVRVYQLGCVS